VRAIAGGGRGVDLEQLLVDVERELRYWKQRRSSARIIPAPAAPEIVRFGVAVRLRFPEGMLWEDIQLATQAHVLAKRVDVIPEVVYYWRERVGGGGSITQRRTDIGNFRDRVTALTAIDQFIASYGPTTLLRAHQHKALKNDLWLYVGDMNKVSQAYRAEFCLLVTGYLRQVPRKVLHRLPAGHKLGYYLASTGASPA